MRKKPESGINITDHISNILGLKILSFFVEIPETSAFFYLGFRDPGRENSDPRSGINIPDPQH
jgi:hypothetical protein